MKENPLCTTKFFATFFRLEFDCSKKSCHVSMIYLVHLMSKLNLSYSKIEKKLLVCIALLYKKIRIFKIICI